MSCTMKFKFKFGDAFGDDDDLLPSLPAMMAAAAPVAMEAPVAMDISSDDDDDETPGVLASQDVTTYVSYNNDTHQAIAVVVQAGRVNGETYTTDRIYKPSPMTPTTEMEAYFHEIDQTLPIPGLLASTFGVSAPEPSTAALKRPAAAPAEPEEHEQKGRKSENYEREAEDCIASSR